MPVSARIPLPPWLRRSLPSGEVPSKVHGELRSGGLSTVCEEARCPNKGECWCTGTATFMVLGKSCTRACRFCSVECAKTPPAPDPGEPARLARAVERMRLRYAVVTTVCRDDLADQGASHVAACVGALRARCPGVLAEFLIQDFRGEEAPLRTVAASGPDVLAHNIETVERLSPEVRDRRAGYRLSLGVLAAVKRLAPDIPTKSSLMLGLGETEEEVLAAFADLREAGVDILTVGQYLRPSAAPRHLPVAEYAPPERFAELARKAREMGFRCVAAGPLVRSSYKAAEAFVEGLRGAGGIS